MNIVGPPSASVLGHFRSAAKGLPSVRVIPSGTASFPEGEEARSRGAPRIADRRPVIDLDAGAFSPAAERSSARGDVAAVRGRTKSAPIVRAARPLEVVTRRNTHLPCWARNGTAQCRDAPVGHSIPPARSRVGGASHRAAKLRARRLFFRRRRATNTGGLDHAGFAFASAFAPDAA